MHYNFVHLLKFNRLGNLSMSNTFPINLELLHNGIGTYSCRKCSSAYEAALVCFDKVCHQPGVTCEVIDLTEAKFCAKFMWNESITPSIRSSWNNHSDLHKTAAEGIALLMIVEFTDYTVVGCSQIGTGVDFFLGDKNSAHLSEEDGFPSHTARLEVSGILRMTPNNTVRSRVNEKIEQSKKSDHEGTPAYIVIVEFSTPVVNFSKRTLPNGR